MVTSGLPHALTRLIGRESEVAALAALLRGGESRLLTLTGPGGVGKSRLAIAAAAAAATGRMGDVAFVDLTVLEDSELFLPAVARALGLAATGGESLVHDLQRAIRDRPVLLLLDGFERIMPAASTLATLLRGCPGLVSLVTSRSRLHVRGERVVQVAPLSVPNVASDASVASLVANPAIALFVDRAQDVRPGTNVTEANARALTEIVQELDGLPLALELAAARLDLWSPNELVDHLRPRLSVLTSHDQDLPDRLRTMRNAISWSYDLLSPDEKHWFHLAAIFTGGCSVAGATAVSGVADQGMALDALRSLTDKSLLWHDRDEEQPGRFRMLETLREFALERLTETGGEDAMRQVHAAWCLSLAEQAAAERESGQLSVATLNRLDAEYPNLQAALGWLETSDDHDRFLRLAAALGWFWLRRRSRSEGRRWLEAAVAAGRAAGLRTRPLARALDGAGVLAFLQGEYDRAEAHIVAYLELSEELADAWGTPAALNLLGVVARAREDFPRARQHFAEALALFRARDDASWCALVLLNQGTIAYWLGEFERAEADIAAGLAIYRQLDDAYGLAVGCNDLARVAADREQIARAIDHFTESLACWRRVGTLEGLADWVARVATVSADRGQYEAALRLFSAVDRACVVLGYAFEPPDRKRQRRSLETARLALDENAVAVAWQEGASLSLTQAIAVGEEVLAGLQAEAATPGPLHATAWRLTPRELDVVRLLVEGQTDRQIGERLFISHRTVMTHVANILVKFDVDSRTAAAAMALRHHLV
ncbi:MAG: LuxR C-terminal-related transcriptional regulator [Thermomicrobiales bacterium]